MGREVNVIFGDIQDDGSCDRLYAISGRGLVKYL